MPKHAFSDIDSLNFHSPSDFLFVLLTVWFVQSLYRLYPGLVSWPHLQRSNLPLCWSGLPCCTSLHLTFQVSPSLRCGLAYLKESAGNTQYFAAIILWPDSLVPSRGNRPCARNESVGELRRSSSPIRLPVAPSVKKTDTRRNGKSGIFCPLIVVPSERDF